MDTKKRRNRFRTVVYQSGLVELLLEESGGYCCYCGCKVFPFSDSYNYIEREIGSYFEKYKKSDISYHRYLWLSGGERLSKKWRHRHRFNLATIDHRIPILAGGTDDKKNLIVCCKRCNSIKGSKETIQKGFNISSDKLRLNPDTGLVTKK